MSNDLEQLTALNRDYVASVQNCDVKRFDEILAPEFYCSNPDKTLVDRAAFLEQTARPIAIRNLSAHDVITILEETATRPGLHAAVSTRLKTIWAMRSRWAMRTGSGRVLVTRTIHSSG